MAADKNDIFYTLKDKDELFGIKGRTIRKQVYDILPQVSKNKFEIHKGSRIKWEPTAIFETTMPSLMSDEDIFDEDPYEDDDDDL